MIQDIDINRVLDLKEKISMSAGGKPKSNPKLRSINAISDPEEWMVYENTQKSTRFSFVCDLNDRKPQ